MRRANSSHHSHRSDKGNHGSSRKGFGHHHSTTGSFNGHSHSASRISTTALSKTAKVLENPQKVPNTYKKLCIELPHGLFSGPNLNEPNNNNHPILFIPPFTGPTCPPPHNSKPVRNWRNLPSYPVERSTSKCLPTILHSGSTNKVEPNRVDPRSTSFIPASALHDPAHEESVKPNLPTERERHHTVTEVLRSGESSPMPVPPIGSAEFNNLSNRKKKTLIRSDQANFYCEPCQKGFSLEEKYDEHMAQHIYCNTPGCNFTCRSDKEDKMREHVQFVHERPNPPNMRNKEEYLEQRRRRYPTSENISASVEELAYQLKNGHELEPERLRWLLQQLKLPEYKKYADKLNEHMGEGVPTTYRKRGREDNLKDYGLLDEETTSLPLSVSSREVEQTSPKGQDDGKSEEYVKRTEPTTSEKMKSTSTASEKRLTSDPPPEVTAAVEDPFEAMIAVARASGNEQMIKLALLAKQQRDMENGKSVSGNHSQTSFNAEKNGNSSSLNASPPSFDQEEDPPLPQSARQNREEGTEDITRPLTKVIAPVAAAKRARLSRIEQVVGRKIGIGGTNEDDQVVERASDRHRGLFERLTQDNRVDDMSLLLQAFRFFTATNFMHE